MMTSRGRSAFTGAALAALALVAACGRGDERRSPDEARVTPSAALRPSATSAPASPIPPPTESATPDDEPAAPPPASPPATLASYPPRDECAALPGFAAFRDRLTSAIRTRDAAAFAALAAPDVNLDFGGGAGIDELRLRLGETRPELWAELDQILTLGCARDGDIATLPWIFSRMPDAVDPFAGLLVRGRGVPLRDKPAADANVLRELDWALVTPVAANPNSRAAFTEVVDPAKTYRGFVETATLRSLLDYRLIAERANGEWRIAAFIAGD